ncbi:hypothetical protein ACLOJK_037307, partial [Asimina triloba]
RQEAKRSEWERKRKRWWRRIRAYEAAAAALKFPCASTLPPFLFYLQSLEQIPLACLPPSLPPSRRTFFCKGSESVVYEGRLEGGKVAVKKPFLSTSQDLDRFHQELQLLCKLEHPALATLVAAHARPPNYMFFFRFYQGGNLAEKLHVEEWNPGVHQVLETAILLESGGPKVDNSCIAGYSWVVMLGLLDENLQPHLADFGLAAYKDDLVNVSAKNWRSSGKPTGGFHKKNMVGTIIYMAPEILRKGVHTEKSDVFSFFISINELLTGVVPYTDLRAEAQAHTVLEMSYTEQQLTAAVVSQGLRPVLAGPESGAPSSLLALIQRGWDGNPQNRPSFDETVEELTSIMKDISKLEKDESNTSKPNSLSDQYSTEIDNPLVCQEHINWFIQGEKSAKHSSLTGKPGLNIWLGSLSNLSPYCPTLSWGSFATCGRRETMEDTHFMLPQMCNEKDIHVFGILDGHRGAAAAEFSAQALPGFLQSLVSTSSPSDALSEAFLKTDIAFRKELSSHRNSRRVIHKDWHPGCTAIAALIVRNKLFVANAGDCRTILCRCGHPHALSKVVIYVQWRDLS